MVSGPFVWLVGLAGLVARAAGAAAAAAAGDDVVTSDTFFYGQSPAVYPSRKPPGRFCSLREHFLMEKVQLAEMTGGSEWATAYGKAKALVAKMSLQERVSLTGGVSSKTGCSGTIAPIPRLNFSGMCLSDSGNGLRNTDLVNAYPAGLHVGASWNKALTRKRGAAMGGEFRRKGVNVFLGPVVGPAGRIVRGGRNWEGFSADPYLSGCLAAQTIEGVQSEGVQTSLKHFIANEQELNRRPALGAEAVSSNLDDRTMHEVYLTPFQDGVRAGTANIMCSYQRVNNSYGCANSKILNGLLKTELGFQGFVVSDWDAQRAGVAAAHAGMDMAMPSPAELWGKHLVEAVNNGSVPESRVTDMATRILTAWYQFGQDTKFTNPGFGMPYSVLEPHEPVEGRDRKDRPTLLSGAMEGHVLVKNTKGALPLRSPRSISVFGYSARSADVLAPSADEVSFDMWRYGQTSMGVGQAVEGLLGNAQPAATKGTLMGGGGSGGSTPAIFVSPYDALSVRAAQDDTALYHDFSSPTPDVMPSSDACLVFGNAWASEGIDRPALSDTYTDTLVKKVASQCNNTMVVLHNAGPRLVDEFADHPNVTAILMAHLPGRESGTALVKLLYGEASPSGKLSYTLARKASDYGHLLDPDEPSRRFQNFLQSDFTEGVYLDYKYFDKYNVTPRYEFGFGLSYTTFELSHLKIQTQSTSGSGNTGEWPTGPIVSGGQADLFDTVARVSIKVRNTGNMAGAEVPQLYVGIPSGPAKQLRGFEKPFLRPGEAQMVEFSLTRRDLSTWDTGAQKWRLQRGRYVIYVGTSSRDLPLRGSLTI
ncbi:hypothetical protein E4U13_002632 [Claviceps humidiphila]|uniref:Beta-glucosidase cel3A n=1 Tax=Claviceps humidiphila TaxID=1294629 RepID=A0A9P7Q0U1_9HYPO|nr:hypothetical protein E4U13_002632 [Claviceps humidiphila]